MKKVLLATDAILRIVIGDKEGYLDELLKQASEGDVEIIIPQLALYCAFASVNEQDRVNPQRIAKLFKYAQLLPDTPEYLGPQDREMWTPTEEEIDNWRKNALK
jgi:hypothetical protein